jgi:hypothetical protein
MRTRLTLLRRKRSRGGAAVELLLSVPFLFLFSVATFDFVRGTRTVACGHRASRHVAWCASRHAEDDTYPDVPAATYVRDAHYYDTETDVTVAASTEDKDSGISQIVPDIDEPFDTILGRGLIPFITGRVTMDVGTVSQPVKQIRLFPATTVTAVHKVSLRTYPEDDPSDPIGWFDPFQWVWDQITGAFSE